MLFQWVTILQACNIAFMVFGKYVPQLDCESGCLPRTYIADGQRLDMFRFLGMDVSNVSSDDQNEDVMTKCENSMQVVDVQFYSVAVEVSDCVCLFLCVP